MFRPSKGSAPVDFVLVTAPMLAAFTALLLVIMVGYQKVQLTKAAFDLAELASLADVDSDTFEGLADQKMKQWSLADASVSLAKTSSVALVRIQKSGPVGIPIEATGVAALEL